MDYRDAVVRWRKLGIAAQGRHGDAYGLAVSGTRQTAAVSCPVGAGGAPVVVVLDLAEDEEGDEEEDDESADEDQGARGGSDAMSEDDGEE